jgi:DNA-binding HxlR family transcriptional regulator
MPALIVHEVFVTKGKAANKECSVNRVMNTVGDRWSILILREAYYGTKRFADFEMYVGAASNILTVRLNKLVAQGVMKRIPLPEHSKRYEYVLTEKGREFFPAYLALKKWGDKWLAEPKGPQVVFVDKATGREIDYEQPLSPDGEPLRPEDVTVVAGKGAVPFNQKRFGTPHGNPDQHLSEPNRTAHAPSRGKARSRSRAAGTAQPSGKR